MNLTKLRAAGILAVAGLAVIGGPAHSKGIFTNSWSQIYPTETTPGSFGPTASGTLPLTVDLTNPAVSFLTSFGVTSLTLDPGVATNTYVIAHIGQTTEFEWGTTTSGNCCSLDNPTAQIILEPVSANTLELSFGGYSQTPAGSASFVLNGTTYSTSSPASAFSDATSENDPCGGSAMTCMTFVGGVLQDAAEWTANNLWTITPSDGGGAVGAPEIDPSSALSAVTLLAGMSSVIAGIARRRRRMAAEDH